MALARDRIRNRQASRWEIARSLKKKDSVRLCCRVVNVVVAGKDLESRYQHGTERAEPFAAYERFLRTTPRRGPWQRIPFEGYTSWSAMCSRSDGLSACLPAYLQSFALLPLFPFFTAIPYAATWSVYLANVGFARVLAESPDDPPERRSNFAAPRTAPIPQIFLIVTSFILKIPSHIDTWNSFLLSKQITQNWRLTLILILTIWFILILTLSVSIKLITLMFLSL